ncbi:hypothetical protein [Reyranella sp.]|uniref:hypothetical protein n=1 Tax=Reyranella sp. TaxID=1929291 RepID=UPI003D0F68E6
MPIVRLYPDSDFLPLRIPDATPNVPAAGDIDLFGGNRARDLQAAGQNLGQTSDTLFALYERHTQQANDIRVQDFNNRFITGMQQILRTGPEAYFNQKSADAIRGAGTATERLAKLKEEVIGQAPNDYQRRKLAPILDAHFASGSEQIARHVDQQQQVYERNVHLASIEVAEQEAISNPGNLAGAIARAADATRALYKGQAPEVIENEARKAASRVVSSLIKDRLVRNDRAAVGLYRQYERRLDRNERTSLRMAVETLSNSVEAADWVRGRSTTLSAPIDAVSATSASTVSTLLDEDGVAGYRQRLEEIEARRQALIALNEQEFTAHPARLRANRTAIETDSAQARAAVNADANGLHAKLRRHLTTGGPNGGPAVTLPSATIMSRLTEPQQDAVTAQINAAIEGRKPSTDPQTWHTIHQGLMADDAEERQRWASKNLVSFMGQLSEEDLAGLEKLQASVRGNGAESTRLQAINRIANRALQSLGINPAFAPDSNSAESATFHRVLQDELSAFESSKGRPATAADAQDIVDRLAATAKRSRWLVGSGPNAPLKDMMVHRSPDTASNEDNTPQADENPALPRTDSTSLSPAEVARATYQLVGTKTIPAATEPSEFVKADPQDVHFAAAGDLKCEGFSAGCQNRGSWGTTATYGISGRKLCYDCAVKILGIGDEPAGEKSNILQPFLLKGR